MLRRCVHQRGGRLADPLGRPLARVPVKLDEAVDQEQRVLVAGPTGRGGSGDGGGEGGQPGAEVGGGGDEGYADMAGDGCLHEGLAEDRMRW